MVQVRVLLRSHAVGEGCRKTQAMLSHELGINIDASPAQAVLFGPAEVTDERDGHLRQTLESLVRSSKLKACLGPVTHDGETQQVYVPLERAVACAASRRIRESLELPPEDDPVVVPFMLVEGGHMPYDRFQMVVGAFACTRSHDTRTPVEFGVAVEHKQGGKWVESYALS